MTPEERAKRLNDLAAHATRTVKQVGQGLEDLSEIMNWAKKAVDRLSEALKEKDLVLKSRLGGQNQLQEGDPAIPEEGAHG